MSTLKKMILNVLKKNSFFMRVNKNMKRFMCFLEKHKKFVGLSEWEIFLAVEPTSSTETLAEVSPDIYEKTLKVSLSESFMRMDEKKQAETLFHELLHGKFEILRGETREISRILEEHMVNDLVRGFKKYAPLKFD